MKKEICIRQARFDDYPAFRTMEERAWQGSGVPIIPEDMFRAWIEVNPELFFVAERDGKIFGHIYSQICDYDPRDESDIRDWATITDNGHTTKTHNPNGSCVYIVSISALGIGGQLVDRTTQYIYNYNKHFLAGACRMPGLANYLKCHCLSLNRTNIMLYATNVVRSFENHNVAELVKDPTLTPMLSFGGRFYRIIEKYFDDQHDTESFGWAALIARPNICQ
jgi:hypothetical protein